MAHGDTLRGVIMANVAGVLGIRAGVAGLAVRVGCDPMGEGEGMGAQRGGFPGCGHVAVIAASPKETGMNLRLGMATDACGWSIAELAIFMAIGTGNAGVLAGQREDLAMGKATQAIHAVVTGGAGGAILGQVFGHECLVMPAMAINASLQVRLRIGIAWILGVAGRAGDGREVVILSMQAEGKTGHVVIEGFALESHIAPVEGVVTGAAVAGEQAGVNDRVLVAGGASRVGRAVLAAGVAIGALDLAMFSGKREGGAVMVKSTQGVAGGVEVAAFVLAVAGSTGIHIIQAGVQAVTGLDLGGNIFMAVHAQFRLICLGGLVAEAAVVFKICMRVEISQGHTWQALGGDRTRAETIPTLGNADHSKNNDKYHRGCDADGSEEWRYLVIRMRQK